MKEKKSLSFNESHPAKAGDYAGEVRDFSLTPAANRKNIKELIHYWSSK